MVNHSPDLLSLPIISVSSTTLFRSIYQHIYKKFVSESEAEAKIVLESKEMLLFVPDVSRLWIFPTILEKKKNQSGMFLLFLYTSPAEQAVQKLLPSTHTVIAVTVAEDVGLQNSVSENFSWFFINLILYVRF